MKKQPGKFSIIVIIALYILSAAFLIYGIYMVQYSVEYVQAYQSSSSVGFENALQYVVTSTMAYFGFALLLFSGATILLKLQQVQKLICGNAVELNPAAASEDNHSSSDTRTVQTTNMEHDAAAADISSNREMKAEHSSDTQIPEETDSEYEIISPDELIRAEVSALQGSTETISESAPDPSNRPETPDIEESLPDSEADALQESQQITSSLIKDILEKR